MLHVATILAAKINEETGSLKPMAFKYPHIYKLEQQVVNIINYKFNMLPFLSTLYKILDILKINKKLGPGFIMLIRYLEWHNIKANFFIILLALKIIDKYNILIYKYIKFKRVYDIFCYYKEVYDMDVTLMIQQYNKNRLI
jgi:hypothetical protein